MRVKFVRPDGASVEQHIAFHKVPQPGSLLVLDARTYRVLTLDMRLTQEASEGTIVLELVASPATQG